ncbi:MAG: hypothetical protein ABSF15_09635 [Candidatus Sulfotelmatobacter sp.]
MSAQTGHHVFARSSERVQPRQKGRQREEGSAAALPHDQRAIEHDPNFAMGYRALGVDYTNLAEPGRASALWRIWEWLVPTPWSRELRRQPMPMLPASGRSPPTKISSPFGKTPIPTSPFLKEAKAEYAKLQ